MAVPPDEPNRPTDPTAPAQDTGTRAGARPPAAAPFSAESVGAAVPPAPVPGYEVLKEFERGGVTIVYTARHVAFNREVALKTLLPGRPFDAESVRRFDTEAHITARLQHPAVPPVFAAGQFPDGRPYTIMKLIRGRNLRDLLKERPSPAHGLPRVLAAFEQVCQAIGFAHSKGVVHRDLKPSNIMIGEFGEVQVVDWGLAKETWNADRGTRTEDASENQRRAGFPTSAPHPDQTQTGKPLGTPAYMPPEQARGEWSRVGPWSDVFALGGILADILTGKPAFVADSAYGALVLAGTANMTDCFARLDACGADPALLAITKRCLAPEPQHRPADGKALADAIAAYRAGVEARLRKAEAERAAAATKEQEARFRAEAEAEAKQAAEDRTDEADRRARVERAGAEAQRNRRRTQLLIAGAVALVLVGGGAFAWWRDSQAADRAAERKVQEARDEAARIAAEERGRDAAKTALKHAVVLRGQRKFREATDVINQAEKLAAGLDDILPDIRREKADIAFARDLDAVRARKWQWVANPGGDGGRFDFRSISGAYSTVFADRKFSFTSDNTTALARRIADSPIRDDILLALDDWALTVGPKDSIADRVLDVAFHAGPHNDLATRIRDPEVRRDPKRLNPLVGRIEEVADSVPATLFVTAILENQTGGSNPGELLALAQAKHPTDFDIALALAIWHHAFAPRRVPPEQIEAHLRLAIGHYRTARALRPDHPAVLTNLGLLLAAGGEPAAALTILREAVDKHPKDPIAHFNYGWVLFAVNRPSDAMAAYEDAIRLDPNLAPAHANLAFVLGRLGKPKEAFEAIDRALRLEPNQPASWLIRGRLLLDTSQLDAAIAVFRKVVEQAPRAAQAHYFLGIALERAKDEPGAAAAFAEAAKLDPKRFGERPKPPPPPKK